MNELSFDICDYQEEPYEGMCSVGDLYDKTKFNILRFYLVSTRVFHNKDEDEEEKDNKSTNTPPEDNDLLPQLHFKPLVKKNKPKLFQSSDKWLPDPEVDFDSITSSTAAVTYGSSTPKLVVSPATASPADATVIVINSDSTAINTHTSTFMTSSRIPTVSPVATATADAKVHSEVNEPSCTLSQIQEIQSIIEEAAICSGIIDNESEVTINMDKHFQEQPLDETLLDFSRPGTKHKIIVHRGQILKEMLKDFKDTDPYRDVIEIDVILPNGKPETAEDNGGVTRDVLSEFWEDFYDHNTIGNDYKVPCLRHDYGLTEWTSIAKIIIFGWKTVGYFPVRLALPFIEYSIHGDIQSDLQDAFLCILPHFDKVILQKALKDFYSVSLEELLDVLGNHDVKLQVNEDNLQRIIDEVAHKEIIQSTMFILDCFRPHLRFLSAELTYEKLRCIYDELIPTPKRVGQKLVFPEVMSQDEQTVSNHLRRFVRELDSNALGSFLRFCTGSDLLICNKIEVTFVSLTGFSRRPVAHTCACILELPKDYDSFPQFRAEFSSVLKSNIWIMDIV